MAGSCVCVDSQVHRTITHRVYYAINRCSTSWSASTRSCKSSSFKMSVDTKRGLDFKMLFGLSSLIASGFTQSQSELYERILPHFNPNTLPSFIRILFIHLTIYVWFNEDHLLNNVIFHRKIQPAPIRQQTTFFVLFLLLSTCLYSILCE